MGDNFSNLLFFSVNLVFIVTNLYGWLLKRFFVPDAYKKDVRELYPAQQSVARFYLLQLFEVPYLLMIGRPEALFYANGTAMLVFTSFIEKEESPVRRRLTEEQRKSMEIKMLDLVKGEKLYLEDHFTMSDLVKRMNTNKAYLSEVIAYSEYGSFYQLINTLRIEHACWMLGEDPSLKMEQVALASGFSSGSAFSQVFKRIKGISPSEYLKK